MFSEKAECLTACPAALLPGLKAPPNPLYNGYTYYVFMYTCCMQSRSNIRTKTSLLAAQAKAAGLSQSAIAHALNASQGQISRILNGQIQNESKLLRQVTEYVFMHSRVVRIETVRENTELMEALASCWDGTPQHAHALSIAIRALGQLCPRQKESTK